MNYMLKKHSKYFTQKAFKVEHYKTLGYSRLIFSKSLFHICF